MNNLLWHIAVVGMNPALLTKRTIVATETLLMLVVVVGSEWHAALQKLSVRTDDHNSITLRNFAPMMKASLFN